MGWIIKSNESFVIEAADPLLVKGNYGKDDVGWSQSIVGLPRISGVEIDQFFEETTRAVIKQGTKIKKHFNRGEQFLAERYIDPDYVFTKFNEGYFFIKGICSASLKKDERWVSLALSRKDNKVSYAFCECPSGNGGQCSHAYALMKLVAKWSLDKLTEIPVLACTSRPCEWSVKKSKGRTEKPAVTDLIISAPSTSREAKRQKTSDNDRSRSEGVKSKMYESRNESLQQFDPRDVEKFVSKLKDENPDMPAVSIMQPNANLGLMATKFGVMPLGSPISFQYSLVPHGFNVNCNIKLPDEISETAPIIQYPRFPLCNESNLLSERFNKVNDAKQLEILNSLKVTTEQANLIEESTRDQSKNIQWKKERFYRFTALKCKSLKEKKTSRAFPTLAKKFLSMEKEGPQVGTNAFVKKKLDHGIYYEPFAISCYENYMKTKNRPLTVLNCGLWISSENFILAATPDGRVIDPEEKANPFGILEVKCPEEYKDYDPADAAIIVRDFCLTLDDNKLPRINQNHGYFDQVQMQMGLTGSPWCDFVVYTLKGMVIDRVYFDADHFVRLVNRIGEFYFSHFLPLAASSQKALEG